MRPQPQILVPFDFGPASERALVWAAQLRGRMGGLPLHVIHVVNPLPVATMTGALAPPSVEDVAELGRALEDAIREQGVAATSEVILAQSVENAILQAAWRVKADLIAMGTHGRSGLGRLVLGSVAEHVLRHAHCPVVTIRSTDAESLAA